MRQLIGETLLSGPAAALTARRKVIQVLTCLDKSRDGGWLRWQGQPQSWCAS
jgi:hypothetical protein